MRLTIAKPAVAAFEGDLQSSLIVLDSIKSEFGFSNGELKINSNLILDTGFQVIVRGKDLEDLGKLEKNLAGLGRQIPSAVHAPYQYDDPDLWHTADLSQGREGYENLLKVAGFSDNIGAESIAIHPNAIREKSMFSDQSYNHERRIQCLDTVINNVLEAQSHTKKVSVDLENKPFPTTNANNSYATYTITLGPFEDISRYIGAGGKLTFDTCHYGITRETINGAIERFGEELTNEKLRKFEMLGYFAKDYVKQPRIDEVMIRFGKQINNIHLNDGSIYRPVLETGRPDSNKRLPPANGLQIWWEAYVPGYGELCDSRIIFPWLKENQKDDRRVFLTLEVGEFDGNYKDSPRFMESARSMIKDLTEHFG
ncbi:hypothetical protein HYT25_01810 [Candidatus Pacearchaeota archaeon]|nr:hypothetical protein [Candidatus Pacearchaeota archaeon]